MVEASPSKRVLVLICGDGEGAVPGARLGEVSAWLEANAPEIRIRTASGLCRRPTEVGVALRQSPGMDRLVLGLCSTRDPSAELQAHIRRAGLDPLGVQAVDVTQAVPQGASESEAEAVIETALAGAVARAKAFRGSRPENTRAVLIGGGERVSRRALFTLPPVRYEAVPTVDRECCAAQQGCDQCVKACPLQALRLDGDTVAVDRGPCVGCGLCVAVCPQRAVELPGWSADEVEAQVEGLLAARTALAQRAIAFACRSVPRAVTRGWLVVPVPCAGMVPAAALFHTLAWGASAVGVSACGEGCRPDQAGLVRGRVDYCRQLVAALGGDPSTVRLLGEDDASPLPTTTPLARNGKAIGLAPFFGRGATARAVIDVSGQHQGSPVRLSHSESPLGLVTVRQDACTGCCTCAAACPTGALSVQRDEGLEIRFDPGLCTGCGECVAPCPERTSGAIAVERVTDTGELAAGARTVFRDEVVLCQRCGGPVASRGVLNRISRALGDSYRTGPTERLCTACRGKFAFGSGRPHP